MDVHDDQSANLSSLHLPTIAKSDAVRRPESLLSNVSSKLAPKFNISKDNKTYNATVSSNNNTKVNVPGGRNNMDDNYSPRPEDLEPMKGIMNTRLYNSGGSNSVQVAQRASGLGSRPTIVGKKNNRQKKKKNASGGSTIQNVSIGGFSFVARRPSTSTKVTSNGGYYAKRSSGRRLKNRNNVDSKLNTQSTDSAYDLLSPPPPLPQTDEGLNGLDVPYGMSDSNPNVALHTYHGKRDEYGEIKDDNNNGSAITTDHQHTRKSITRGDLLRQAQHFKTFMEIMEEHPLYEMPYGDSFLYLMR
jgi:hypothetical protein